MAKVAVTHWPSPPLPPPPLFAARRRRSLPAGCIVVNKPHGVPFHATADHSGLLHLIREQQGSEWLPYEGPLHPVHR